MAQTSTKKAAVKQRAAKASSKKTAKPAAGAGAPAKKAPAKKAPVTKSPSATPKLLSGGNPQIPKADGDAPVQAYIEAMPGWKRDIGKRIDQLVERAVPGVEKAVRWNSPFYGMPGQGWFFSFHCFTKYVKLSFFRGSGLRPLPPGTSKQPDVRYLDVREDEPLDEKQLAEWVHQASQLPGWSASGN